jgi:hypothetical protein
MINQQRQGSSIDKEYIKHLTTLNEAFSDEDKDEIFSDVSEFLNEKIDKNITIATLLKSKIFNEVHKTTQVNDQHMDNLLLDKNIIIHSLAEIKEKIQNINKDTILIKKEKAIIDYSNKYINKILRDLHLLFLNNKGKNIYGDTDFAIMDHINSIRTEVNKREDITDIEKRQVKDFLLKTHKFIVFFSNSVKEFFIDNDASYKDFFMYFS